MEKILIVILEACDFESCEVHKFNQIDFKDVKEDVIPFINDINSINLWGIDFFVSITDNLSD